MSFKIYDDAITKKITFWTKDTDVHIYSPDDTKKLFQVIADKNNDKPIKLPLIAIRRKPSVRISSNKMPLTYDGLMLEANIGKSLSLNAIPMQISYQIDIYTRYQQEADELIRNIVFNIINFPTLTAELQYNNTILDHESTLTLADEIQDSSAIPERLINGQFTRFTLDISVNNAYLWDVRLRDNYIIEDVNVSEMEDEC